MSILLLALLCRRLPRRLPHRPPITVAGRGGRRSSARWASRSGPRPDDDALADWFYQADRNHDGG